MKVNHTKEVNCDFSDGDMYPDMSPKCYMHYVPFDNGDIEEVWNLRFKPLQNSILMNLRDLTIFDTIGEVIKCTHFLSREFTSTLY